MSFLPLSITAEIMCCWIASSTLLNKDGQNSKKKRTTRMGGPFFVVIKWGNVFA